MKYKISTYVLSVLLMITIIYACDKPASSNAESSVAAAPQAQQPPPCFNRVSKKLLDSLSKEPGYTKTLERSTGGLIKWKDAKPSLDLYKNTFGLKCKEDGDTYIDIYGFAFGMDNFKEFARRVIEMDGPGDTHNLLGVRVYMGLKSRKIDDTDEMFHDVFLVPIHKDGDNIYAGLDECTKPKKDPFDDGTILNTSMLCPNRCNDNP